VEKIVNNLENAVVKPIKSVYKCILYNLKNNNSDC